MTKSDAVAIFQQLLSRGYEQLELQTRDGVTFSITMSEPIKGADLSALGAAYPNCTITTESTVFG